MGSGPRAILAGPKRCTIAVRALPAEKQQEILHHGVHITVTNRLRRGGSRALRAFRRTWESRWPRQD